MKIKWARLSKVVDELKLIDAGSRQGQPSFIALQASNHLMDFFAHTENTDGNWHKLADHLRGVGQLAAEFAAQMNQALLECAHLPSSLRMSHSQRFGEDGISSVELEVGIKLLRK